MAHNSKSDTKHPLSFSSLKNHAVPFPDIKPDMYVPRLKAAISLAKEQIDKIKKDGSPASFENTIIALETAGEDVDLASGVFYNQLNANTNDQLQALAAEIGPLLAAYSSDIQLDPVLFRRIQTVYEADKASPHPSRTVEDRELLEKYYSGFTRNGALLPDDKKSELREIDAELSKLGPQFAENVLKATNEFQLLLTTEEEIAGLPPTSLEAARSAAQTKGHESGWLITLHAPSYIPFMQYGRHRPSREKLFRAYGERATKGPHDNRQLLLKTLQLRERRAQLLGYKNHAEFTLEKRMAENPEKVVRFLNRIEAASLNAARADVKKVEEFAAQKDAPLPLMPWDFTYWSERLKEHLFQFNSEDLRPYFKLENVIQGVFEHARMLYGLKFRETSEYPTYHPDVKTYEVYEENSAEFVGLFYADFFPRESKNGGAWMTNYFEQGMFHGEVHRPHVAIVCNFTPPTEGKASLLTFDEVQTLFHEFGHALHSLLSKCRYRSLSGTNVYWDFVELPSQIMENWTLEKESLDLFAQHFETGEKIPAELTQKIKESSLYMAGYMSLRQVTFAKLDMAYHTSAVKDVLDPFAFEEKITGPLRVLPKVEGTNFSCGFTHVFAGGYSAGYYSYKWAEVLDADAFELFQEKGLFDRDTARRFKEAVLSRGGSEHPMELYKKFRGREPDPDALLRRDGLI